MVKTEYNIFEQVENLLCKVKGLIKNVSFLLENYIPTGGKAGQVLAKKSNKDYDLIWIDPPESGGGGGEFSFEEQSFTATQNQSIFDITVTPILPVQVARIWVFRNGNRLPTGSVNRVDANTIEIINLDFPIDQGDNIIVSIFL